MQTLRWGIWLTSCVLVLSGVLWSGALGGQKSTPVPTPERQAPTPPRTPRTWEAEPTTFRGLPFGEDLRGHMAECPSITFRRGDRRYAAYQTTARCWERFTGTREGEVEYTLQNFPPLGAVPAGSLMARQAGDRIVWVRWTLPQMWYADLAALLRTRYGPPTHTETWAVTTRMGATFPSEEWRWEGIQLTLRLSERSSQIEQSLVSLYSQAWMADRLQRQERQAEEGARGLDR